MSYCDTPAPELSVDALGPRFGCIWLASDTRNMEILGYICARPVARPKSTAHRRYEDGAGTSVLNDRNDPK